MDFYISLNEDVVNLRRETRNLMRSINASLPVQAHISWLTDYIARQMLNAGGKGSLLAINTIELNGRFGIKIVCEGNWLKDIGPFYQRHLIPALSRKDEVSFSNNSQHPQMSIVSWV
jgi:hypothetical protein